MMDPASSSGLFMWSLHVCGPASGPETAGIDFNTNTLTSRKWQLIENGCIDGPNKNMTCITIISSLL